MQGFRYEAKTYMYVKFLNLSCSNDHLSFAGKMFSLELPVLYIMNPHIVNILPDDVLSSTISCSVQKYT